MSATAGTAPPPEWYLARDGDQFGPLSDGELRKLVEFGHLKPSDLLWREGFPDWRSAKILLDDKSLLGQPTPDAPKPPPAEPPAPTPANKTVERVAVPTPHPVTVGAHAAAPVTSANQQQPARTTTPAQRAAQAAATQAQPRAQPAAQVQPRTVQPQVVQPRPIQPQAVQARPVQPQPVRAQAVQARPIQPGPILPQPVQAQAAHLQSGHAHAAPMATAPVARGSVHHAQPQPRFDQPGFPAPGNPAGHSHLPQQGAPFPGHLNPEHFAPGPTNQGGHAAQMAPARPMDLARPAAAAPIATATRHAGAAPIHRADDDEDYDEPEGSRVVVWIKRLTVLLFFALTLAAAGWYAYPFRDQIFKAVNLSNLGSIGSSASPISGFKPTPEATDATLQATPLWQVLKRDFPEWYGERVKEAVTLAQAQKSDAEIGKAMVEAMVALRRKHAGDALSATMPRLKALAAAFADNLVRLRQVGVEACHTFISTGETSPEYLRLLADPAHSRALQSQLVAVFEAIADGRKIPRIYPQPKQADYNLLVTALETRGWSEADMQLFSDSRQFGQAAPEKVCKMVTDWFQAQIDLKDPDAQLRLLADALKPVVAG